MEGMEGRAAISVCLLAYYLVVGLIAVNRVRIGSPRAD